VYVQGVRPGPSASEPRSHRRRRHGGGQWSWASSRPLNSAWGQMAPRTCCLLTAFYVW